MPQSTRPPITPDILRETPETRAAARPPAKHTAKVSAAMTAEAIRGGVYVKAKETPTAKASRLVAKAVAASWA